jgi:hypothetical protein
MQVDRYGDLNKLTIAFNKKISTIINNPFLLLLIIHADPAALFNWKASLLFVQAAQPVCAALFF